MEMDDYIDLFKKDYHFRFEQKTIKECEHAVRHFYRTINKSLNQITKKDIRSWLNYLSESGYKDYTINTKLIRLKAFLKYYHEEGLIKKNPADGIQFKIKEVKIPNYLDKEQLNSLRNLVKGNLLDRAIIEVLYATGIRNSELIAMKISDINWQERSIFIPKGKRKKERIVLFNHECEEHLKIYLVSRDDNSPYVFINSKNCPLIHQRVNDKFVSYSKLLGFRVYPHLLRHTFAAHLAQKGMPVIGIQSLLGHDNPKTTHIYAKLYDHARKEIYDQWM